MPAAPQANLSFLPWVRQGAASAIATIDTLGPRQPAVADVSITLNVNNQALPAVPVRLRGPADVVGIDAHQVVRTDPRPNTGEFESNCFPSIEFDRADFPWLFTPLHANTNAQLRPWLCLVVVRRQEGVQITSSVDSPLPVLRIAAPAKPFIELPDLKDSWAWAHGQAAAGNSSDPNAVDKALNGAPQLSLSRLVCPRLLTSNTDYIACVVPAFDLGRKAGLGQPIADAELTAATALAPAWTLTATTPLKMELPVYYTWSFRTGPAGDFESLARRLKISVPEGLGQRTIDVRQPGFPLPATFPAKATVKIEGALMPLNVPRPPVLWSDSIAVDFEKALANIVNQPGLNQVIAPGADPLLAPPLYGQWHAGRARVTQGTANWFDELNLDPRWRTAAAIGTSVIQEHQEALMASAWEQAAEIQPVNQTMRQLQMSMAVGERLHARHLMTLTEERTLRFAAPVFSRLRVPSPSNPAGRTLTATMSESLLPVPATRTAMRRIGRQRGPLTRRLAAKGFGRSLDNTWVAYLNVFDAAPAPVPPAIVRANLFVLPTVENVATAIWNSGFQIAAEGQPVGPPPVVDPLPPAWDYPGYFRAAAAEHLSRIRGRLIASLIPPQAMHETATFVRAQMHPRVALANLARAVVKTGDNVLQPTAPGVTPLGTETVMMAPSFPEPMYEPLKEKSQDLLLPGLDKVDPDTVLGLRTNRAFVEAYMIGLNVEMARELLWRGFPTDQQGTYFKRFWGSDAGSGAGGDIDDLRGNLGRELGAAPPTAPADEFVLLLRSTLLRRYPNAIIYLTPALTSGTTTPPPDIFPIFSGSLDPDVNFVGFPVSPGVAIGSATSPGYFLVIQEHPTEPRFGLDVPVVNALGTTKSHLTIGTTPPAGVPLKGRTWGKNSAHMAEITRRLPVRITIHASELVALP
jgi:hypothetical protein